MTINQCGLPDTNISQTNNNISNTSKKKFAFKKKISSQTSNTTTLSNTSLRVDTSKPKKKFAFKKKEYDYYKLFTDLCLQHNLNYFQFYDTNNWTGPAIKVLEDDFDTIVDIFEDKLPNKTIILNGLGFVIIRPINKMSDEKIDYTNTTFSDIKFTESPVIPYNSDTEDDSDEEISVEEEFIAEEWVYNQTTYLLDTKTNYVYFPSTFEFAGKKTSEFSIDVNAKEL